MRKSAFTMAEMVIAIAVLGVLSVVLVKNVSHGSFSAKENYAQAVSAFNIFDQAFNQMATSEPDRIPSGQFIDQISTTQSEFGILTGTKEATLAEILDLFSKYIKIESDIVSFCDYSNIGLCGNNKVILGGKIAGNRYFGIEKYVVLKECASAVTPEHPTIQRRPIRFTNKTAERIVYYPMCWGRIYIDVNGKKAPNSTGVDIFSYDIDEHGLAK